MSNEVVIQQNFQERMMERIRGSIGELMTEEELKKIVEKAVNQIFFEGTTVKVDNWHNKTEPPFIHKLVKDLLEAQVKVAVQNYMVENKDTFRKIIQKIIQEGMGVAVFKAFENTFSSTLSSFQYNIEQKFNLTIP